MTARPEKSKQQLIDEERAAERTVVEAEYEARAAAVSGATGIGLLEYDAYVDEARRRSLGIRAATTDGLAQWHRYDSDQELARTARELGIA